MTDHASDWTQTFSDLFHSAVNKYQQGHQQAAGLLDDTGVRFLATIGYSEQEFFDFVEDFAKVGEPTLATALKIAAVRRDYFLQVQKGVASTHRISMEQLPPKDAELDGIVWLPRLIPKAVAKLRGEMPTELMYCCGGDRRFFRTHQIEPSDFLLKVWQTNANASEMVAWVKASTK